MEESGESVGLVGLAVEMVHEVALGGWLGVGEVGALGRTCRRMAEVLVWDEYGRDLHHALEGVVENVWARRWKSVRYAMARGWWVGEGEDEESRGGVWREVLELGVEDRIGFDETDLAGWEDVMLAALSLPGVRGWGEVWEVGQGGDDIASLLHIAAKVGSVRVVNWVLERGGDLEVMNQWDETPLWIACRNGHVQVVEMLVEGGADVTIQDGDDASLLIPASLHGHAGVVEYLMGLGKLDVNEADYADVTPLRAACANGHSEVVRLLVEDGGADVDVEGEGMQRSPLFDACRNGNVGCVQLLVDGGSGSGAGKEGGVWISGLMIAALFGNTEVVRLLLSVGVGVDGADPTGDTALAMASRAGNVDVVRVLIEGGCDVNKPASRRVTPLEYACLRGREGVVRLLLEAGADAGKGRDLARDEGHGGIVDMLDAWDG